MDTGDGKAHGLGGTMDSAHRFETPTVRPPAGGRPDTVCLRVAPPDAQRILRALDEASFNLATTPGGSRIASSYRALAADLRLQAARI